MPDTQPSQPKPRATSLAELIHERDSRPLADLPALAAKGDIVKYWMLRILVDLGGMRRALNADGFVNEAIADHLGLPGAADGAALKRDLRALRTCYQQRSASFALPAQLNRNLERVGAALGLSAVDKRLLGFAVLFSSERLLDDTIDYLGSLTGTRLRHLLADLLELPRPVVAASLDRKSRLAGTGLLSVSRGDSAPMCLKLRLGCEGFVDQMLAADADPLALMQQSFFPSAPALLSLQDFQHMAEAIELLQPYLRKSLRERRGGVNVLIHGKPGGGKTQFVKAVAAALDAQLFELSSEDEDGDPLPGGRRLFAYRAAQQVLGGGTALLLFDEAEDVLGAGPDAVADAPSRGRKAWINRALENNAVPAFWLSNVIGGVDAAFLRRFDLVIEITPAPAAQRARVIERVAGDLLPRPLLDRLAGCDHLAPAVVARAAAVVSFMQDEVAPERRAAAVSRLITQSMAAQRLPPLSCSADGSAYGTEFCNADADLTTVAAGLSGGGHGARLCLYGDPGTGKTAWAQWLARRLDRPLVAKRASDLLDPYVGQSEKNLAGAFAEARERNALLLIDEVDSFMPRRDSVQQQWQLTQINELLTQMETFDGLFVATTNFLDTLDGAALRRFDLKIRFDALTGSQVATLLTRQLASLGLPPADDLLQERARRLIGAVPGDFAAVARRHRFSNFRTAAELLDAVVAERGLRDRRSPRPIGFAAIA